MSNKISKKCLTNVLDLGGFSKIIYDLLLINPSTKYVIQKTKKSRSFVSVYINRLIKKNYIERSGYGFYKVLKKPLGTMQISGQPPELPLKENDYYRLHNIELKVRLNKDSLKHIKNIIYGDMGFFNVRNNVNGDYFTYKVNGLITRENLFIFMPKDFELVGNTIGSVYSQLKNIIDDILIKWGERFNLVLFKNGRVNYEIVNQHLSLVNNGIAKGLREEGISNKVKVYDDEDGKVAYMFDMSKGFDELESPHPTKAPDYIDKAAIIMDKIKSGDMEKLFEDTKDMKLILAQQSLIISMMLDPNVLTKNAAKEQTKGDTTVPDYIN